MRTTFGRGSSERCRAASTAVGITGSSRTGGAFSS